MTLQDYIKLADSATDGPWWGGKEGVNSSGGMVGDIICNQPDWDCEESLKKWPQNAQFIAASRTLGPAMAKALIEAGEALKLEQERTGPECYLATTMALKTIQALNGGEDDKQR